MSFESAYNEALMVSSFRKPAQNQSFIFLTFLKV